MVQKIGKDLGLWSWTKHIMPQRDGYRQLLSELAPRFVLGMTATPWRGDERRLEDIFGDPTYTVSIVEGMQLGYLATVDYRMMVDTIDWDWVRKNLNSSLSIRELNRRLFIPERDEGIGIQD